MAKEVGRNPIVSCLGMLSKTLLPCGSLEEHVWWIQVEYNGDSLGKFHSVYGLDISFRLSIMGAFPDKEVDFIITWGFPDPIH